MKSLDLNQKNLLNNLLKLILYFGIALFPLYIFNSGSIQIGHFLLIIFSILVFTTIGIKENKYFYIFGLFLFYTIIVNIFYLFYDLYFTRDPNIKFFKDSLFLTYNFILTASLTSYFAYQKKFNIILYGLITAILLLLYSWVYGYFIGLNYRFVGFFNNPNQLGYFCACCFSLTYLFYRNSLISYKLMISMLLILILLSISSLSKAAYISLILCFVFALKPFNYKYSKIVWIIFLLTIIFFIILFFPQISEANFYKRIISLPTEQDSSLEVRGYLVYFKSNFLQAFLGMGPKNVVSIHWYEIHSTFAMILSSYGLVGFSIFGLLMFFWILDINRAYGLFGVICICAPTLLYGLTHNGIRFSMFWILFALSIILSKEYILNKNLNRHFK